MSVSSAHRTIKHMPAFAGQWWFGGVERALQATNGPRG
jgi:hypothetical protein